MACGSAPTETFAICTHKSARCCTPSAQIGRAHVRSPYTTLCRSPPPSSGWVVTNPPYGVRVSTNRDLRNLYAQIGKVLHAKCPDRKSPRPLSLHDALPISASLFWLGGDEPSLWRAGQHQQRPSQSVRTNRQGVARQVPRSEEPTSALPTRRSADLRLPLLAGW